MQSRVRTTLLSSNTAAYYDATLSPTQLYDGLDDHRFPAASDMNLYGPNGFRDTCLVFNVLES